MRQSVKRPNAHPFRNPPMPDPSAGTPEPTAGICSTCNGTRHVAYQVSHTNLHPCPTCNPQPLSTFAVTTSTGSDEAQQEVRYMSETAAASFFETERKADAPSTSPPHGEQK